MLLGTDIRKYRRALGLSQQELADRLGVSQSTLSLIEGGRIPLSEGHLDKLNHEFNKGSTKVKFADFLRRVQEERRTGLALVGHPDLSFATVPVWLWEPNFDLGAAPSTLTPRCWITVRAPSEHVISFEMPKGSAWWASGEILAFRRTEPAHAGNGDLALVQLRVPKLRQPRTLMAIVRWTDHAPHRDLQLEPAEAPEGMFTPPAEQIEGFLRCFFRARYLPT